MSTKPENQFISGVHKYISPKIHVEKMNNPYRSGTADCWYSGLHDWWIEWKYIEIPVRDETVIDLVSTGKIISPLQRDWLHGRYDEGRNIAVGVGSKQGGVLLHHLEWEEKMNAGDFRQRILTRKELADLIQRNVGIP